MFGGWDVFAMPVHPLCDLATQGATLNCVCYTYNNHTVVLYSPWVASIWLRKMPLWCSWSSYLDRPNLPHPDRYRYDVTWLCENHAIVYTCNNRLLPVDSGQGTTSKMELQPGEGVWPPLQHHLPVGSQHWHLYIWDGDWPQRGATVQPLHDPQ